MLLALALPALAQDPAFAPVPSPAPVPDVPHPGLGLRIIGLAALTGTAAAYGKLTLLDAVVPEHDPYTLELTLGLPLLVEGAGGFVTSGPALALGTLAGCRHLGGHCGAGWTALGLSVASLAGLRATSYLDGPAIDRALVISFAAMTASWGASGVQALQNRHLRLSPTGVTGSF